jgi:hypothetical protein
VGEWLRQPLLAERAAADNRRARLILFLIWIGLTAVLAAQHVPWRDEARAWSLTLAGENWAEMFRIVQGEGHPYAWYILLRAGHDLFGAPEVLRITGLLVGIAAAALLVFRGPFRIGLLALVVFSMHLGFEYTVLARNYGISTLIMLGIAASWARIRDTAWLGILLLLLCNTNVPGVFLAGSLAFYRLLELAEVQRDWRAPEWRRYLVNCLLLLLGALLCFLAVYPPANDAAASSAALPFTFSNLFGALFTAERSFMAIGFPRSSLTGSLMVILSLLIFVDRRKALATALLALVCLKLFFFFVYPGFYRHSALFFILMLALGWIEAEKGWLKAWKAERPRPVLLVGLTAFMMLMVLQTVRYVSDPLGNLINDRPYSHAADLAAILERPEYRGSMLMIDPDAMGEAVAYQTGRPYWLIRQDRPGRITPFSTSGNKRLTLHGLLEQAEAVRQRTGRPVIIALWLDFERADSGSFDVMYRDYTVLTPASIARFEGATRKIARLRGGGGDEEYDVYVYPR